MTDDLTAFTIRIPKQLRDQIRALGKLNHRNLNGEINELLAAAMDERAKQTASPSQIE